jgi:bifunctional non-homologous end joining protein LigD
LRDLPTFVKAKSAILDGEIVALDEHGRSSFASCNSAIPRARPALRRQTRHQVLYYAFDVLYLEGYDLASPLERASYRAVCSLRATPCTLDHFVANGKGLFEVARSKAWKFLPRGGKTSRTAPPV